VSVGDVLERVRAALVDAGIPYMLTGSFASAVHGAPRATQDIDVVIAPSREQLLALVARFPQSMYYVSADAAIEALADSGQFNVIDLATGWKIDFIIRKRREFSEIEFDRRRRVPLSGVELDVASAEDMVIAKLEWAKAGNSSRQIEDAASVVRVQGDALDVEYITRWVAALHLEAQWLEARAKAV
jgi:hypothetical protein